MLISVAEAIADLVAQSDFSDPVGDALERGARGALLRIIFLIGIVGVPTVCAIVMAVHYWEQYQKGRGYSPIELAPGLPQAGGDYVLVTDALGGETMSARRLCSTLRGRHGWRVLTGTRYFEDQHSPSSLAAVVLVLTEEWSPATLRDPDDPLAMAIGLGLREGLRMCPIQIDGDDRMPQESDLPPALKQFAFRQAQTLRSETWEDDVAALSGHLKHRPSHV